MIEKIKEGRPTKYKEEFNDIAYKLSLLGLTNEEIAIHLGVGRSTLSDWVRDKTDFSEAIKRGREGAGARVIEALYEKCLGYERDGRFYPSDTTAMIFFLKNKFPAHWKDRRENIIGTDEDLSDVFKEMADKLPG